MIELFLATKLWGVFYEILWRLIDENRNNIFALQMKFVCLSFRTMHETVAEGE